MDADKISQAINDTVVSSNRDLSQEIRTSNQCLAAFSHFIFFDSIPMTKSAGTDQ